MLFVSSTVLLVIACFIIICYKKSSKNKSKSTSPVIITPPVGETNLSRVDIMTNPNVVYNAMSALEKQPIPTGEVESHIYEDICPTSKDDDNTYELDDIEISKPTLQDSADAPYVIMSNTFVTSFSVES